MAMEQQFRVIPGHFGVSATGTTVASLTAALPDWEHTNFAANGGVLTVPFFTAARIRGLVIAPTATVVTPAPVFTTIVMPVITLAGTGTGRTVNDTATARVGSIAGDVWYCFFNDDDIKVNPGEQVTVRISTAAGAASTGYVALLVSDFLVGPTSGGTATVPVSRAKPYGTGGTGTIKVTSSASSGN